jgi:hypothetical protein
MTSDSPTSDLRRVIVIAAAVMISGAAARDARLDDTKPPIERLDRPFETGLRQIELCLLFQERRPDHTALFAAIADSNHKCPIEQKH